MKVRIVLLVCFVVALIASIGVPVAEASAPSPVNITVSDQAKAVLPCNAVNDAARAVSSMTQGTMYVIYATKINGGYDILVSVNSDNTSALQNYEVITSGKRISAEKIQPKLVSQTSSKEIVEPVAVCQTYQTLSATKDSTSQQTKVTSIVRGSTNSAYQVELKASASTGKLISPQGVSVVVSWYTAESYIYGKNLYGNILWRLTAKGNFYIQPGVKVLQIIDQSNPWCVWYGGFDVSSWGSCASISPDGSYGQVDATATFRQRPTCTNYDVRVYIIKYRNLSENGGGSSRYRFGC